MKNIFKLMLIVVVVSISALSFSSTDMPEAPLERNYFQFVIPKYETTRQGGQTVNIYVKFAYKPRLPTSQYVDYILMRQDVLKYMEPTDEFPVNTWWELIATQIGREMMVKYPLDGVSVFLEVLDNQTGSTYEPGDHGPIFTAGHITPLDIHH